MAHWREKYAAAKNNPEFVEAYRKAGGRRRVFTIFADKVDKTSMASMYLGWEIAKGLIPEKGLPVSKEFKTPMISSLRKNLEELVELPRDTKLEEFLMDIHNCITRAKMIESAIKFTYELDKATE